jgi:excisionase family DNA binding protein
MSILHIPSKYYAFEHDCHRHYTRTKDKEAVMERLKSSRTGNDYLIGEQKLQVEDALIILVRMITIAVLKEKSLLEQSQYEEYRDSAVRPSQVTKVEKPGEPLTLSVEATARMLGLSRALAYEAIHTGQIPSLRFGHRIVVPRAALNGMLSKAGTCKSDHRRYV